MNILTWFFNVRISSTSPNTPESLPCIPAKRSMVDSFNPKVSDSQFFFKYLRKAISLTTSSNVMTASFSITILSSIFLGEAILFVTTYQDNVITILAERGCVCSFTVEVIIMLQDSSWLSWRQHPAPVTTSYIRKTQRTSEQLAQDGGAAFGALGELLK